MSEEIPELYVVLQDCSDGAGQCHYMGTFTSEENARIFIRKEGYNPDDQDGFYVYEKIILNEGL